MKTTIIVNGKTIHLELYKTIEEWRSLYGDESAECWDFPFEELVDGTIEPDEQYWYWYIDGRFYETNSLVECSAQDELSVGEVVIFIENYVKQHGTVELGDEIDEDFGPDEYYAWTCNHYHTLKMVDDRVEVYYDYSNPFDTDHHMHCELSHLRSEVLFAIKDAIEEL